MADMGLGAGLGALAFWGFVAACVLGGIWDGVRRREARHETLRRLIDSGQTVDQALIDKILGGEKRLDRDLRVYGVVMLCLAPGLAVMGWLLSHLAAWALLPLLGAAAIVACLGIGLLVAANMVKGS